MATKGYKWYKEEVIHKEHEKITTKLQRSLCIRRGHQTTKPRREVHKPVDTTGEGSKTNEYPK